MLRFKRGMALLLALCMVMSFVLMGRPVVANAETYDPYVYTFEPDPSTVPTYYQKYAKAFAGWSPHMLPPDYEAVWMFNLVNMTELIEDQSKAPSGGYATVQTFCGDLYVDVSFGNRYRRIELEDARFGASTGTTKNAEHIRALVEKSMPYVANPKVVQDAANAYLGTNKVKQLTGSELASAIQAAIWYYSDADEFVFDNSPYFEWDNPYFGEVNYRTDDRYSWMIPKVQDLTTPMDFDEPYINSRTSDNIYGVYRYLLNLAPQKPQDVMIPEDAIYMESAVVMGSGSNCTLKLTVGINGTIDGDDDLVLTAKCGSQTKTYQLGKTTTAEKVGDGLYAITFTGVSKADCASVELALSGEQRVTGAYYFEAERRGNLSAKYSSQGMVGYLSSSAAPVQSKCTVKPLETAVTTEITKVDKRSGNPLSGVSFDLYMKQSGGDVKVGTFTTDENGKIAVMVTDSDAEYYFVEAQALTGYQAVESSVASGQITNDWSAGSLEVSKKLVNTTPAEAGETFNFELTLDLSTAPVVGNGISWMTDTYFMDQLECSKPLSWSVAGERKLTATFTLNADETVTVDSIPLGTTYTIAEIQTDEDREWFTVTTKVDDEAVKNGTTAEGSVAEKNAVLFTNSVITADVQVGELAVSKKLINTTPAEVGETFNFKITIDLSTADAYTNAVPWLNDDYLLSFITSTEELTWTAENGKYTAAFTVDADETVTISGLAQGTTYTVEEIQTDEDREWFTVTTKVDDEAVKSGTTAEGSIAEKNAVLFTNEVVKTDGPGTGDSGIGFPLMLCFLAMLSAAILVLNRRRFI